MAKQTIEIDVPDGYEVTGEHRAPRKGEWYVGCFGEACYASTDMYSHFVILREKWQPRPWMPEGAWLAIMDEWGGDWYLLSHSPATYVYINPNDRRVVNAEVLARMHGEEFVPPPVNKIKIHH